MKEIIFYKKENWNIPMNDFIENFKINNKGLLSKIYYKLNLLRLNLLWNNDIKYIENQIYELRIKDNSNIIRIFYFSYINNKIILLDWYIKKENKLKRSIINKIINYKKDYLKKIWKI